MVSNSCCFLIVCHACEEILFALALRPLIQNRALHLKTWRFKLLTLMVETHNKRQKGVEIQEQISNEPLRGDKLVVNGAKVTWDSTLAALRVGLTLYNFCHLWKINWRKALKPLPLAVDLTMPRHLFVMRLAKRE